MSARRDKPTNTSRRRANRQRLVFIIIGILVILAYVLSLVGSP
jgi:predicted nucleic acid-binding Zn ribbon protein